MNTKILVAVLVVLVLGGGWWYYSAYGAPAIMEDAIAPGHSDDPGSVKQDVALIVSESVVGKWQSSEDPRFVREFKEGGVAADLYNDEVVTEGTWSVYEEGDAVYIRMVMQGSQAETLTFKLTKLTPESLELVYMERGGVLTFTYLE